MGIEDKKLQSKDPYSEWHKMLNEPVLYTKRPERVKFGSIEGRIVCLANIVFVAGRFVIEESTLLAKAGWNFIVSSGLEDGELKTQMREDVWYDLTVACVKVPTNISYLFQLTLGFYLHLLQLPQNLLKQIL